MNRLGMAERGVAATDKDTFNNSSVKGSITNPKDVISVDKASPKEVCRTTLDIVPDTKKPG